MDYTYSPWNSPGQNTGVSSLFPSPGDPNPGVEPRSPTLQVNSLLAEPPEKPIAGVGAGACKVLREIYNSFALF